MPRRLRPFRWFARSRKRRPSLFGLEPLEGRCLPSVTIKQFVIPTSNSQPTAIVSGPDGALWFTESNSNKIGRITTAGAFTEYTLPAGSTHPNDITVGPDGNLWFAENGTKEIGRITTAGAVTEFAVPGGGDAVSITTGPDGALWFAVNGPNEIGRITTAGVITTYSIPVNGNPVEITTGPDGNLWFTQNGPDDIIRLTPAGVFTEYVVPTGASEPTGIVAGPDGALWFTENKPGANKIGRITTTGTFTGYTLPTPHSEPTDITVGADGNLWFTLHDDETNSIGEITPAGAITEYAIPTSHAHAEGIASGPDGAIWFVENNTNKIGQAVTPVPLTVNGASISATEGATFQGTVATITNADPSGVSSDYTATITWGDGATSSGTISGNAQQGYTVTGSHVYAKEGTYSATVSITDTDGATGQANDTTNVADAPLTATAASISVTEGASFQGTVATFTDADPSGVRSDYTVTIVWGDGSTSTGTVSANGQGGFTVSGSHVYKETGTYTATVSIADIGGATAQATDAANVADAPLTGTGRNITIGLLAPFSGVVASFADANAYSQASDFTATIDWGDGSQSSGTITANSQGGFDVSGLHTYLLSLGATIQVTVTDDDGGASVTIWSGSNEGSLTVKSEAVAATEGLNWSGEVADIINSLNPGAGASQYTATITWGDGFSSTGTLTSDGNGGFKVLGAHTYTEEGSYSASIQVQWSGGASANASDAVQVADAPLTALGTSIAVTEGANFHGTVATFTDANPDGVSSDYTATINWGDGYTSTGMIVANAQGGFTVTGSHVYAEDGTYTATVSIADVGGATAQASDNATVADAALAATGTRFTIAQGSAFQGAVATFTDANPYSTLSDFTAVIAWGDGNSSSGLVAANPNGRFIVAGSHTYTQAGSFTAVVSVADQGGSSAQASTGAQVTGATSGTNPTSPPSSGGTAPSGGGSTTNRAPSSSGNSSNVGPPPSSTAQPTATSQVGLGLSMTLELLAAVPASTGSGTASAIPADQHVPHVTALADSGSAADPAGPTDKSQPTAASPASAGSAKGGAPGAVSAAPPTSLSAPPSAPGSVSSPLAHAGSSGAPIAPARSTPHLETPQFTNALDRFQKDVDKSRQQPRWAIDAVFAGGVVTAGYVALTTRAVGWLMTALLSRPVWKAFDPLEVLFAWEAQQKGRAGPSDEDGETLQSLVT